MITKQETKLGRSLALLFARLVLGLIFFMAGLWKGRRPSGEASATTPGCGPGYKRQLVWLNRAVTVLWIATLLFIVGYATVKGEMALADLDQLDLLGTYSLAP